MSVLKEKAQVIMLPSKDNAGSILLYKPEGTLQYFTNKYWSNKDLFKQHLYIVSDEEIKGGEWFINLKEKQVLLARDNKNDLSHYKLNPQRFKKVIATTDSSLKIHQSNCVHYNTNKVINCCCPSLPQSSQGFIEKYIKEYNKGNIITDILVEYENLLIENPNSDGCAIPHYKKQLKVSKDNTITIHPIKNSWDRKEVIDKLKKLLGYVEDLNGYQGINLDEWTKHNL